MFSRIAQLAAALVLLLFGLPGWSQSYRVPAASVEEQFSAYHEALSDAADQLLSASGEPTPSNSPVVSDKQLDRDLLVQFARQYWDGQEQNVRRAAERVTRLKPTLEPILKQEGVPVELAALVLVESGGRNTALSPKGALGLWQFMPETARRYGLVVSSAQDERVDVVKSTRAAARYLRDLHVKFGDWALAFAAYNAGEQTVQNAVERNSAHDLANLRLPTETRNYVPAVFSAIELLGGKREMGATRVPGRKGSHVLYATTQAGT